MGLTQLRRRGIMHRDLKPDNIFIDEMGKFVIGDFGLVMIDEGGDISKMESNEFTGTDAYMAPEQLKGLTYTCAVDVWQLGCVMIEFIRGIYPQSWQSTLTDRRGYSLDMKKASLEEIDDAVQRSLRVIVPDVVAQDFLQKVCHHRSGRRAARG